MPTKLDETRLIKYDTACRALAEAKSVDEVKDIMNKSIAIQAYARQAKNKGLEADAFEIRFRAERRLGEMLQEQPKATGTRNQLIGPGIIGGSKEEPPINTPTLEELGINKKLSSRSKKLAQLDDGEFEERMVYGREKINEIARTATLIVQNDSVEWYTPKKYIESARKVMGHIDLDPASCKKANNVVNADIYYTKETDGLSKEWISKTVWLNPPYGKICCKFVNKLIDEYKNRTVNSAILLVNANATDVSWFQPLFDYVLCFTNHRLNFDSVNNASGSTHGSCFVYFGQKDKKFADEFSQYGNIVKRWPF